MSTSNRTRFLSRIYREIFSIFVSFSRVALIFAFTLYLKVSLSFSLSFSLCTRAISKASPWTDRSVLLLRTSALHPCAKSRRKRWRGRPGRGEGGKEGAERSRVKKWKRGVVFLRRKLWHRDSAKSRPLKSPYHLSLRSAIFFTPFSPTFTPSTLFSFPLPPSLSFSIHSCRRTSY